MNTSTKTKTGLITKRWEVFNKRTDKTVKFVDTRAAARAVKNTKSNPLNYGIYDTYEGRVVR